MTNKEYQKAYREANKEKAKEYRKNNKTSINKSKLKWAKANKEKEKKRQKAYRESNPNRTKKWVEANKNSYLEYQKDYREANKIKRNKHNQERRVNDFIYRLSSNVRSSIRKAFKTHNIKKCSKTHSILGCSYEEFKLYLESKFESWMNWDNMSLYNGELNYGWDLDHIIPISSAVTEEDVLKLNHYTNYQPLCGYTNRHIKRDIIG